MITTNSERIAALTVAGSWGADTLHGLLARNAVSRPRGLAIKDQPNREQLTGDLVEICACVVMKSGITTLELETVQSGCRCFSITGLSAAGQHCACTHGW